MARRKLVATVVVPWRPTAERELLWSWLQARWAKLYPHWEVVEGLCPDGPWRKGIAVADGVAKASHDLLVVADADVWCDGVGKAAEIVAGGAARWAMPHHLLKRLTASATDEVLASGEFPRIRTTFTYSDRPYPGHPGGGMVVLNRATYEQAPIDPRFSGWGQEDDSWAVTLRLLAGREWRGLEDLWHLWHSPQPRMNRSTGNSGGAMLARRYWSARSSPRSMEALVAEGRLVEVG